MSGRLVPKVGRRPVASSNIAAVGFYAEDLILEVEFLDGSVYHYFDVPEAVYEYFIAAPSKGKYHWRNIVGRYRYEEIKAGWGYKLRRPKRQQMGRREGQQKSRRAARGFRLFACDWCYDMLGAIRTDDLETIRSAYHKKAHEYHPDKGGDEETMKKLNEAFALIKESIGKK